MTASIRNPIVAEERLNTALWRACCAVYAAMAEAERRNLSPAATEALARASAEEAAGPDLAAVIRSPVLRDAYARAAAAEAVRMVRENGPPPEMDGPAEAAR